MPPWSPSADGVIAICAPSSADLRTSRVGRDVSLMATLARLSHPPSTNVSHVDGPHFTPLPDEPIPDAVLPADLRRLSDQLHAEIEVIRRQLPLYLDQ